METAGYKRVVLKLSGESLAGDQGFGINPEFVEDNAAQVKKVRELGIDVAARQAQRQPVDGTPIVFLI